MKLNKPVLKKNKGNTFYINYPVLNLDDSLLVQKELLSLLPTNFFPSEFELQQHEEHTTVSWLLSLSICNRNSQLEWYTKNLLLHKNQIAVSDGVTALWTLDEDDQMLVWHYWQQWADRSSTVFLVHHHNWYEWTWILHRKCFWGLDRKKYRETWIVHRFTSGKCWFMLLDLDNNTIRHKKMS